jgi:hypothetical protein
MSVKAGQAQSFWNALRKAPGGVMKLSICHISANTVRTHLQNLMAKLGAHTALEAVALPSQMLDEDLFNGGCCAEQGM